MSLGGGETQSPVADSNKYAQIMELMRMRQNMSPMSTYTGGFDYSTPSSVSAAPSSYYDELMRQQALASANQGRGGSGEKTTGWSTLSPAQQAAYYADNPTMSKITQTLQSLFGYTTLGALQKALDPTFVSNQSLIARGIDPANLGYLGGVLGSSTTAPTTAEFSDPLSGGWSSRDAGGGTTGSGFSGSGAAAGSSTAPAVGTSNNAQSGGWGSRDAGGGTTSGGSGRRDAGGNTGAGATNSRDSGGWGSRDAGGNTGGDGGFYKGGQVTMNRLQGPNPMGPDDGYGGLDDGEFVINAKSVGKYGIELMNAINNGKISKGKLRGLLEA